MAQNTIRHKQLYTLLAGTCAFLTFAPAAQAQYYEYNSNRPSVEMNLDILGIETPQPLAPARAAPPPVVERSPLPENFPFPAPVTEASVAPASSPAPLTDEIPQPRVLKPVFSAQPAATATLAETPALPPVRKPLASTQTSTQANIRAAETPVQEKPAVSGDGPKEIPALRSAAPPPPATVPTKDDLTLAFDVDDSQVNDALKKQLDTVIAHMKNADAERLQVRAYATGENGNKASARRISLSRALSVRSYLMDKGIAPTRVDVRALGMETDRGPLDRVDLVFVR